MTVIMRRPAIRLRESYAGLACSIGPAEPKAKQGTIHTLGIPAKAGIQFYYKQTGSPLSRGRLIISNPGLLRPAIAWNLQ